MAFAFSYLLEKVMPFLNSSFKKLDCELVERGTKERERNVDYR